MSSWVFRRSPASLANVLRFRKRVVLAVIAAAMLIGWAAAPTMYRSRVLMEVKTTSPDLPGPLPESLWEKVLRFYSFDD